MRHTLTELVKDISPEVLPESPARDSLADAFVTQRAVPPSKPEDAAHVAAAFVAGLDVLVSWNFKHIATVRRAERFNAIAVLNGYTKPLRIVSPLEVSFDDPA